MTKTTRKEIAKEWNVEQIRMCDKGIITSQEFDNSPFSLTWFYDQDEVDRIKEKERNISEKTWKLQEKRHNEEIENKIESKIEQLWSDIIDVVNLYRDSEFPINEILDTLTDNLNAIFRNFIRSQSSSDKIVMENTNTTNDSKSESGSSKKGQSEQDTLKERAIFTDGRANNPNKKAKCWGSNINK